MATIDPNRFPQTPSEKTPNTEKQNDNLPETPPEVQPNTPPDGQKADGEKRNDFDENVYKKNYDNDEGRGYRDDAKNQDVERPADNFNR